jgi:putative oxidoreductase
MVTSTSDRKIMEILFIVGRILFAFLFLGSGIAHFTARAAMTGYAEFKKVPAAKLAVPATGAVLVLGAISVALGIYPVIGSLALAAFLIPTAILMHNFWTESDAQAKMNSQISFNKDIALAGAALVLAYVFATVKDLPFIVLG